MIRIQKIIFIIWVIVAATWVAVVIANVITSGWEIIGVHDIWPMALCGIMMIIFARMNLKPPANNEGETSKDIDRLPEMTNEEPGDTDETPDAKEEASDSIEEAPDDTNEASDAVDETPHDTSEPREKDETDK